MLRLICLALVSAHVVGQQCTASNTNFTKAYPYCMDPNWPDNLGEWSDKSKLPTICRPLGFTLATMKIYNDPPVCLTVPNSIDHQVDVMVQTVLPGQRICVTDSARSLNRQQDGSVNACGWGKLRRCFTGPTDKNLTIMIYCDEGCEDDDVSFFWRVRINEVPWNQRGNSETGTVCNSGTLVERGDDPTKANTCLSGSTVTCPRGCTKVNTYPWCYLTAQVASKTPCQSTTVAGSNPEMWCMMISGLNDTSYPADLLGDEPEYNKYRHDTLRQSSASMVAGFGVSLIALVAMVWNM